MELVLAVLQWGAGCPALMLGFMGKPVLSQNKM